MLGVTILNDHVLWLNTDSYIAVNFLSCSNNSLLSVVNITVFFALVGC